jgi:hypothetical protein
MTQQRTSTTQQNKPTISMLSSSVRESCACRCNQKRDRKKGGQKDPRCSSAQERDAGRIICKNKSEVLPVQRGAEATRLPHSCTMANVIDRTQCGVTTAATDSSGPESTAHREYQRAGPAAPCQVPHGPATSSRSAHRHQARTSSRRPQKCSVDDGGT